MAYTSNYLRLALQRLVGLTRHEREAWMPIPWSRRLWLWRHGFLSKSGLFYDLTPETVDDYITEIFRTVPALTINEPHNKLLNDKLIFERMIGARVPTNYAWLRHDKVLPLREDSLTSIDALTDFCVDHPVVLKPNWGTSGRDILFVRHDGDDFEVNGVKTLDLQKIIRARGRNTLVTEWIKQAPYSSRIFPRTVNTLRVLTMWDVDKRTPFIARAVHRFGKASSVPVDNWSTGGLSALIDLDTGAMGKAACWIKKTELAWFASHPETGTTIEGVELPGWAAIRDEILAMAARLHFVPYIGWDIVITAEGFRVIEGNNCTGLNVLQVHGPLGRDPRVRRFYDHYARWI